MGVSSTGAKQSNSTQVDAGNVTADYPNGGGLPGLKTTNTGKTGIPSVEGVDPTTALNYFQTAGNNYQTNALQGLQYYQQQLQNAISTVQAGYQQANAQLEPIATRGSTASNQFMTMLGLNAPSPTRGLAQQAASLGGQYTDVASLMRQAETTKDPSARQMLLSNITSQLNELNSSQMSSLQQQQQAEIAALGPRPTGMSVLGQMMSSGDPLANQLAYFGDPNNPQTKGNLSGLGNLPSVQAVGTAQKNYDAQVAAISAKYAGQLQQFQSTAGGLVQQFSQNYDPNDTSYFAKTPDEINQTLSNTVAGFNTALNRLNGEDIQKIDSAYLNKNVPGFDVAFNRLHGSDTAPIDRSWMQANNPGLLPMYDNFQTRDQAPMDQAYLDKYAPGLSLTMQRLNGSDSAPITQDTLRNSPGYQFMYDQGNQAVLAAAAAGGMLGSGNTLTAADKYSQGLAQQVYQYETQLQQQKYATDLNAIQNQQALQQSYYNNDATSLQNQQQIQKDRYVTDQQVVSTAQNSQQQLQEQKYAHDQAFLQSGQQNYMNNLMQEAGMGANASSAMATNDANSGVQSGNLYQAGGQAALNAYTGIGSKLFDTSIHQGDVFNQDALSNMSAQNAMIMAMVTKGAGSSGQIAGLAGLANSMNNQQQMANGFNNAISGGNSLFGGGGVNGWNSIGPIGGDVGSGGNGSPSF